MESLHSLITTATDLLAQVNNKHKTKKTLDNFIKGNKGHKRTWQMCIHRLQQERLS